MKKYLDPKEVDSIAKIQNELDETQQVLRKTIDSVLQRGEKLDTLIDKSNDLSASSKMFAKSVRSYIIPRFLIGGHKSLANM